MGGNEYYGSRARVFLTDLDSRAGVKGSRDPLAIVPLWAHFGRKVVGNLTTVTGSVRGFTTTLLGYYFAREVRQRELRTEQSTLALFLKFEQLAGYCRYLCAEDGEFRGITYVKRNLDKSHAPWLSQRAEDQILSNQKIYGLWGLFSVASRASGLLQQEENELTPEARAFVEAEYIAALTRQGFRDGRPVIDLLSTPRPQVFLDGKHRKLAEAIAQLFKPKYSAAERVFYQTHLVFGGPKDSTGGSQRHAATLMAQLPTREGFSRGHLRQLIKQSAASEGDQLKEALQSIDWLESVLVPAAAAFAHLQGRHGHKLKEVADELHKQWGPIRGVDLDAIRKLSPELENASGDAIGAERWVQIAQALGSGEYGELIRLVLTHNSAVMQSRNGSSPWVRAPNGRLEVRFRDELAILPARRDLPTAWVNNYFLNPLKDVVGTLAEG
jgi:hypothetical protein